MLGEGIRRLGVGTVEEVMEVGEDAPRVGESVAVDVGVGQEGWCRNIGMEPGRKDGTTTEGIGVDDSERGTRSVGVGTTDHQEGGCNKTITYNYNYHYHYYCQHGDDGPTRSVGRHHH